MCALNIVDLRVSVCGQRVLNGVTLSLSTGEIHALVGKNGAGKSSLAKAIAGSPGYDILSGEISMDGESLIGKSPDEIAKKGFFLAFQNPVELPGVSVANFIRAAMQARMPSGSAFNAVDFYKRLHGKMEILGIDKSFASRPLNDGFSGGEKKRCEMLQLLMLEPKYAIFDEIDSGLDIDALKVVADALNGMRGNNFAAIVITHHSKLLDHVTPDFVHVIADGNIALSGGPEIIGKLEKFGYAFVEDREKL
jgi:Fe-S cluster assembly ATP-binding protein